MKNWKHLLQDNLYLILFGCLIFFFFFPFFVFGKFPIPADAIVGMYYPWKNIVWDHYTAGVPFKNFLITDPVRQQYIWRKLAIDEMKKGNLPLWNPYSFSGTLHLANIQSAAFYPLNFVFFFMQFPIAWGFLVFMQPLLAGIFFYFYLRHFQINKIACILGSFTFAFSGFSIAWLEWNTIGHVMLWLPLVLLSIEKILPREKHLNLWLFIFTFSLVSSFLAGHLQIFFYSFLFILMYLIIRISQSPHNKKKGSLLFVFCFLLFAAATSIQWFPAVQFIINSARNFDQGSFIKEGWFLPWQHLIQFIAPDFFGNPATLNYWGVWNYGEFIGYIGIPSLLFVLYALFFRRDRKTLFFGLIALVGFLFALPNPLSNLPYIFNIPFLVTSQPTRILSLITFSLSVLTAFGCDAWLKEGNKKRTFAICIFLLLFFVGVWIFISLSPISNEMSIAKRNLILPSILFIITAAFILMYSILHRKMVQFFVIYCLFFVVLFDFFRFGWKFISFSPISWIFPETKITHFLGRETSFSRILSLDRTIMPPNFSVSYGIFDTAGYDPLYLKKYGQLVASWEREKPDISPAAFNRIITPTRYEGFITDLLGIRYILSPKEIQSKRFILREKEGMTYIYENRDVFPRAFFAEQVITKEDDQRVIEEMFHLDKKLRSIVVVKENIGIQSQKVTENEYIKILTYNPNEVVIKAKTDVKRLLLLTDMYYPSWKAYIDGTETKIYESDFTFRGVIVPAGIHTIIFRISFL